MGDNRRIKRLSYWTSFLIVLILLTSCTFLGVNGPDEIIGPKAQGENRLEEQETSDQDYLVKDDMSDDKAKGLIPAYEDNQIDTRNLITETTFLEGISGETYYKAGDYKRIQFEENNPVLAGIIPHHLVANSFIADFYESVSKVEDYDLIVLISPNHYTAGPRVQIGASDYYTYQGQVSVDQELIYALTQMTAETDSLINIAEPSYLELEHGQLVHMPYIKTYFPQAKVLSIMLAETRDLSNLERLADTIDEVIGERKTLFVGSIDFSHYLTAEEAELNDEYTRSLILDNDYETMSNLSNDYIDSPSTFGLLTLLLEKRYETFRPEIFNHSNSARITGRMNSIETTSYFQVVYYGK